MTNDGNDHQLQPVALQFINNDPTMVGADRLMIVAAGCRVRIVGLLSM